MKHPRLRGEDLVEDKIFFCIVETPPPARGRLNPLVAPLMHERNTPACAGKTFFDCKVGEPRMKHPRLRGEDCDWIEYGKKMEETPPPARGRLREISRKNYI
jgi:hypothetical protein